MNRDEMVEACVDTLGQAYWTSVRNAVVAILNTVEPLIRADERERIYANLIDLGYDYPAEVARNGGRDE